MANPKSNITYHLLGDEVLVECPYNQSHHVRSEKMLNHLLKCRRNHELEMARNGEQVQFRSCTFNWHHLVPEMEILHHEENCCDRHVVTAYVIEYCEENLHDVLDVKKCYSYYATLGLPRISGKSRGGATAGSEGTKDFQAAWKNATGETPMLNDGQTGDPLLDDFDMVHHPKIPYKMPPAEKPLPEGATKVGRINYDEDWEAACKKKKIQPYDMLMGYNNEHKVIMKYPPNLTKAQRKTWLVQNCEKAERLGIASLLPADELVQFPAPNGVAAAATAATATEEGKENVTNRATERPTEKFNSAALEEMDDDVNDWF